MTAGGITIGVPIFVGGGSATVSLAILMFIATFTAGFVTAMDEYDGWEYLDKWLAEEWPKVEKDITDWFADVEAEYKSITSYRATDDPNFNKKNRTDENKVKVVSFTNYEKWSKSVGSSTFLQEE